MRRGLRVSSSGGVVVFTACLFLPYGFIVLGLLGRSHQLRSLPAPCRNALLAAAAAGPAWYLYRLATRSCNRVPNGLIVRGIWQTYGVPWVSVKDVVATTYMAFGGGYEWSKVAVQFNDRDGHDHVVDVSANRSNKVSVLKADFLRSWPPAPLVGVTRTLLIAPNGEHSELSFTVRRLLARWRRTG